MKTKEYREQLAETFLTILSEKQLDWKKDWSSTAMQRPVNIKSGKCYKGINWFYLTLVAFTQGYQDYRWGTWNQIQEKGWYLKDAKGKGVKVEYWYPFDREQKKVISWETFRSYGEEFGDRFLLRANYYTVFNEEHIVGIEPLPQQESWEIHPDRLIGTLSRNMEVKILHDGGNHAFYSPREDRIHLPKPETFFTDYGYASTALHELTHATGAAHRLHRNLGGKFGSKDYAFEELIAEISSCFMSANLQIKQDEFHIQNHKAYVQGWIQSIKEEPELLVKAVQQAEQAAEYMEYKAELIPEPEFLKTMASSMEVSDAQILSPEPVSALSLQEVAYELDNQLYLYIQTSENGYDYTFYDQDLRELNGGRWDNPDLSIREAGNKVLEFHEFQTEIVRELCGSDFIEKAIAVNQIRDGIQEIRKDTEFFKEAGGIPETVQKAKMSNLRPEQKTRTLLNR